MENHSVDVSFTFRFLADHLPIGEDIVWSQYRAVQFGNCNLQIDNLVMLNFHVDISELAI